MNLFSIQLLCAQYVARNSSNHELLVEETCCQGAGSRKANMVASPRDCAFKRQAHAILDRFT